MDQLLAEVRAASREFWLGGDATLAMSRVSGALRQYDESRPINAVAVLGPDTMTYLPLSVFEPCADDEAGSFSEIAAHAESRIAAAYNIPDPQRP